MFKPGGVASWCSGGKLTPVDGHGPCEAPSSPCELGSPHKGTTELLALIAERLRAPRKEFVVVEVADVAEAVGLAVLAALHASGMPQQLKELEAAVLGLQCSGFGPLGARAAVSCTLACTRAGGAEGAAADARVSMPRFKRQGFGVVEGGGDDAVGGAPKGPPYSGAMECGVASEGGGVDAVGGAPQGPPYSDAMASVVACSGGGDDEIGGAPKGPPYSDAMVSGVASEGGGEDAVGGAPQGPPYSNAMVKWDAGAGGGAVGGVPHGRLGPRAIGRGGRALGGGRRVVGSAARAQRGGQAKTVIQARMQALTALPRQGARWASEEGIRFIAFVRRDAPKFSTGLVASQWASRYFVQALVVLGKWSAMLQSCVDSSAELGKAVGAFCGDAKWGSAGTRGAARRVQRCLAQAVLVLCIAGVGFEAGRGEGQARQVPGHLSAKFVAVPSAPLRQELSVEELGIIDGLEDGNTVKKWLRKKKGISENEAGKVVVAFTALNGLSDEALEEAMDECQAPSGGQYIDCLVSWSGQRRRRRQH